MRYNHCIVTLTFDLLTPTSIGHTPPLKGSLCVKFHDDRCKLVDWLVGCGLTSHSMIFQLYSDGTVVQFPNVDLLPGTQRMGS